VKVELHAPGALAEPRIWVRHEQALGLALQPGSIEVGSRRSEMSRKTYNAGEIFLYYRHVERWIRADDLHYLSIVISDDALTAACDGINGEVELQPIGKLVDARVGALTAAVNAERIAGFPSGRLFLDSVEQALAAALVDSHAVQRRSQRRYRGGLGAPRLRRIQELVQANMEGELTLDEMSQSVGLSTAHFSQMFRQSTGESPHQFVLRNRVERAKEMLQAAEMRVLEVAVACGFKTQQHFARVFRRVCGVSPTEYRHEFLSNRAVPLNETYDESPSQRGLIKGH
jgi:AraC family transcriptional regulator